MGACECENPMEFGYEVNTTEKDEKQIQIIINIGKQIQIFQIIMKKIVIIW